MYDDLDILLKTRKAPDVPEHLSARILAAAARQDDVRIKGARNASAGWFGGLFDVFALRPAVALTVLVLFLGVGLYAGAEFDVNDLLPEFAGENLASFMMIDDDAGFGDWV